jgi:ribosomal protein L40E
MTMQRTIHVCDRCKAEAEGAEAVKELQLGRVVFGFDIFYSGYESTVNQPSAGHRIWDKQWCRKCREELGILQEEVRKDNPAVPVPSLEDMVREIVRCEIQNNQH